MQLGVRDVAKLLSVSEKTIYRWISKGSLPAYRVNDQYRFNRSELLEWVTAQKINYSPEIFHEPQENGIAIPSLAEALRLGGIYYRLAGSDKASAIRSLAEIMRLSDEIDRESLVNLLLAREELASTGIGEGIALPHPRNPIVLHVERPMVTLGFLEHPVDFGALDGKPVFALFSVVSPTTRAHLQLLSRLSFALRNPSFKEAISGQASRDDILAVARQVEDSIPTLEASASSAGA